MNKRIITAVATALVEVINEIVKAINSKKVHTKKQYKLKSLM